MQRILMIALGATLPALTACGGKPADNKRVEPPPAIHAPGPTPTPTPPRPADGPLTAEETTVIGVWVLDNDAHVRIATEFMDNEAAGMPAEARAGWAEALQKKMMLNTEFKPDRTWTQSGMDYYGRVKRKGNWSFADGTFKFSVTETEEDAGPEEQRLAIHNGASAKLKDGTLAMRLSGAPWALPFVKKP